MATLTDIQTRVEENLLFLANATTMARIEGWIQDAQARLEEKYNFPEMRFRYTGDASNIDGETTADNTNLTSTAGIEATQATVFGKILKVSEETPYYLIGDTGEHVDMRWLETRDQVEVIHPSTLLKTGTQTIPIGSPKWMQGPIIDRQGVRIFRYFPASDGANTVGTDGAGGEYRIRFFIWRRLVTLTTAGVTTNFFSEECDDYLEHWATMRAAGFNKDAGLRNEHNALAREALGRIKRREKLNQIGPGLALRPRAGYLGSRFSGRL